MNDVRISIRSLAKDRTFSVTAVVTLVVAIGFTTAIATTVDTVLLRPLPYPRADRLVQVISYRQEGAATVRSATMARPFVLGLAGRNRSFSAFGVFDSFSNITRRRLAMTLAGHSGAAELYGTRISPVLLSVLGARPVQGRLLAPGDDRPERNGVIVLSERSWRSQYDGDPGVVGSSLTIDGRMYTLIGIMPSGFAFPDAQTDFWIPLTPAPPPPPTAPRSDSPNSAYADGVFGLLRDGISVETASAEVDRILRELDLERASEARQTPEQIGFPRNLKRRADVVSMKDELVAPVRPMLQMLSFATALLLLIACANLVGLFLERIESHRLDLAVRTALGAARSQILRPFVIEGILLALAGGAIGLAVASWLIRLVVLVVPPDVPRVAEIAVRLPVLVIMILTSAAIGAVIGAIPAWRFTNLLGLGFRGIGSRRIIVVGEIAVAAVLCVGAGLVVRSFIALVNVNPGYDAANVTTFRIVLPTGHANDPTRLYADVLSRLDGNPAIQAAAATDVLPIAGASAFHLTLPGLPTAPGSEPMITRVVSREYFQAMGIAIVEGRTFTATGRPAYPELLVNQEFVRRYFDGRNPIGRLVGDAASRYQVVGVVNDVRNGSLSTSIKPEYYVDLVRFGLTAATRPYFVVRSTANSALVGSVIRSAVRSVDSGAGVDLDQQTMTELVAASVAKPRFNMFLLATFATAALVLAMVGIYGVMAHAVTQRTKEIGIRMALGATPFAVLSTVLGQSLALTGAGTAIGLFGAATMTKYLESLLFELTPLDPATFGGVALIWLVVALLAAYLPAWRASRVDPIVALRHD